MVIWVSSPIDKETGELTGPEHLMCKIDGTTSIDPERWWTHACANPITTLTYRQMTGTGGEKLTPPKTLKTADPDDFF
jgi:hypothetical protein